MPLNEREAKAVRTLKHVLATIRTNKIQMPFCEQMILSTLNDYGQEHIEEVKSSVLAHDLSMISLEHSAKLFDAIERKAISDSTISTEGL